MHEIQREKRYHWPLAVVKIFRSFCAINGNKRIPCGFIFLSSNQAQMRISIMQMLQFDSLIVLCLEWFNWILPLLQFPFLNNNWKLINWWNSPSLSFTHLLYEYIPIKWNWTGVLEPRLHLNVKTGWMNFLFFWTWDKALSCETAKKEYFFKVALFVLSHTFLHTAHMNSSSIHWTEKS